MIVAHSGQFNISVSAFYIIKVKKILVCMLNGSDLKIHLYSITLSIRTIQMNIFLFLHENEHYLLIRFASARHFCIPTTYVFVGK